MSRNLQLAIGGIVIAIILFALGVPLWVPIVILVAVPVVGYLMLDSNQRKRIRRIRQRRQLTR